MFFFGGTIDGKSMDWFQGKFTPESPLNLMGKSMVSCKISLKPIQSNRGTCKNHRKFQWFYKGQSMENLHLSGL